MEYNFVIIHTDVNRWVIFECGRETVFGEAFETEHDAVSFLVREYAGEDGEVPTYVIVRF